MLLKSSNSVSVVYWYLYGMYICAFVQFIVISMCNVCLSVCVLHSWFGHSGLSREIYLTVESPWKFAIPFLWITFFIFTCECFCCPAFICYFFSCPCECFCCPAFICYLMSDLLILYVCIFTFIYFIFTLFTLLLFILVYFFYVFFFFFICFILFFISLFLSHFNFFIYLLYLFFSSFIFWSFKLLLGFAYLNICISIFHESKWLLHNV